MQNVTFKYTWNSKVDLMWGCQNFNILWKTWNYIFFVYSEIKLEINNKWEFSSVAQFCPTLCDPMDCSTPGLHVHHQLPEFTQTHAHWVGDVIQPSYPLSSPSPPSFNLSQYQDFFPVSQFFASGGQSIGFSASASVLPMYNQDWSPLGWTGLISLVSIDSQNNSIDSLVSK